ncbi:MAG: hypothetical protein NTZ74_08915 [Chloroflexi bacterium]|nr:hypothetical protein [Chloroflexota bacterium]
MDDEYNVVEKTFENFSANNRTQIINKMFSDGWEFLTVTQYVEKTMVITRMGDSPRPEYKIVELYYFRKISKK